MTTLAPVAPYPMNARRQQFRRDTESLVKFEVRRRTHGSARHQRARRVASHPRTSTSSNAIEFLPSRNAAGNFVAGSRDHRHNDVVEMPSTRAHSRGRRRNTWAPSRLGS